MAGSGVLSGPVRPILDPRKCRVRPKQGGALLPPGSLRPEYVHQGRHQGLAVVRPSIPVSMCPLPWMRPSDVDAPRVPRLGVRCVTAQLDSTAQHSATRT